MFNRMKAVVTFAAGAVAGLMLAACLTVQGSRPGVFGGEALILPLMALLLYVGYEAGRLSTLAQAEKEGRLVVLEHAAKKGEKKPPCFYNDMGQEFCLGLARGECDDEPIDRCKECWYCESTREAAEAALEEREMDE